MNKLFKNRAVLTTASILVIIVFGLITAWQSSLYTLNHMSIKTVTTTQLAAAMRQDEFWSMYRFNTLIFNGKVKNISSQGGKTTVNLKTSDTYGVTCIMASPSGRLTAGKSYTFEAETYQAQRQPHAVLLQNCINP